MPEKLQSRKKKNFLFFWLKDLTVHLISLVSMKRRLVDNMLVVKYSLYQTKNGANIFYEHKINSLAIKFTTFFVGGESAFTAKLVLK